MSRCSRSAPSWWLMAGSAPCEGAAASAAAADVAAGGAEVAAVLVDQRRVAALGAVAPSHCLATAIGGRRLQQAHLAQRIAVLVEDAQHRVAVDRQPREIGHRRRPGLLARLVARE